LAHISRSSCTSTEGDFISDLPLAKLLLPEKGDPVYARRPGEADAEDGREKDWKESMSGAPKSISASRSSVERQQYPSIASSTKRRRKICILVSSFSSRGIGCLFCWACCACSCNNRCPSRVVSPNAHKASKFLICSSGLRLF
jgi:hypothetical protein